MENYQNPMFYDINIEDLFYPRNFRFRSLARFSQDTVFSKLFPNLYLEIFYA